MMTRNASRESRQTALLYAGGKSNKYKPSILLPLFLTIFIGLALPAEARQRATISAGIFHSLGIRTDGVVVAWGDNESGQSAVPPGLGSVTDV